MADRTDREIFLVMQLCAFAFETPALPVDVVVDPGEGCLGYLPVYASREAAELAYPGAVILRATVTAPGGHEAAPG